MKYVRPQAIALEARLKEAPRLIQILAGPRQVGKSTLVQDVMLGRPLGSYLKADAQAESKNVPGLTPQDWLEGVWQRAAAQAEAWSRSGHPLANELAYVLVIDEVQHLSQWPTFIKGLWDAARHEGLPMHLVLLGSAPLLVQKGLNEGLTGRFELIRMPHWSLPEMQEAFGVGLDEYLYFGAYPGSAHLFSDAQRWRDHVRSALIEPSIERDVLALERVDAPATLRQLFELGCEYSAQELSLDKVRRTLGAGHGLTLAHHLTLLGHAGLLTGLRKYAAQTIRQRQSPPKFQVLNNALLNAQGAHGFEDAKADRSRWGRIVESAVGAHLLNTADADTQVFYWRESNLEVDFVVQRRGRLAAIEVKSGQAAQRQPGLDEFCKRHPEAARWVVGSETLPVAEFLMEPVAYWVK